MTQNQMELEFYRFQKQSLFPYSKERLQQKNYVSNQRTQNTSFNKSATFAFKNQKIKFRFPIIDEISLDSILKQQEYAQKLNQNKMIENQTQQNQVYTRTSTQMEEENKENINQISIQQSFYEDNKILTSAQINNLEYINQQIQNKLNEQYF